MPTAEVVMPANNRSAGDQSSYEAPAADTSEAMPQRRSYAESPSSYRSQQRGYSAAPDSEASAPDPQPAYQNQRDHQSQRAYQDQPVYQNQRAYQNQPTYENQPTQQNQPDFDNSSFRADRGQRRYEESEVEPQPEEQNQ
jgi:hypothetical protein